MLKHVDFTPTCLGTRPGVISPWVLWSPPAAPQGGLSGRGQQHNLNSAHSPMSPLLLVVTGLRGQGKKSWRSASPWGALSRDTPEVLWTAAGAADLAATWLVPGRKDRKAEAGTDMQQGVEAAAGGPHHRRGCWKCPKVNNCCFYDHVWAAMGLEFRNNGYEENQNKVLPSPTEDRCRSAREDGAGVRVQCLGRGPSRDEGGRTAGRPLRRPLGSLEGPGFGDTARGRGCPQDGEKVPKSGRRLSSGVSEPPAPTVPGPSPRPMHRRTHMQAAHGAHPSAWSRLPKFTPSPLFTNLFPSSGKSQIFPKRETNTYIKRMQ